MREYQREWMRKRRQSALEYLGNRCFMCGCVNSLEFDHVDSSQKTKNIQSLMSSKWETLKTELDKCQLLCEECHKLKTKALVDFAYHKLDPSQVAAIREAKESGARPIDLAKQYGVTTRTIRHVTSKQTWDLQ